MSEVDAAGGERAGIGRLKAPLFAAVFAAAAGAHALTPIYPEVQESLGASEGDARLLTSLFTIGYSVSGFFLGALSDRLGRRAVLVPSLFAYAVASALLVLPLGFVPFLLLRFAGGLCVGGMFAVILALVADAVAYEHRGRAMSFVMSGSYVAMIAGVPLAAQLARVHVTAVFGVLAVVALAAALRLAAALPADCPPVAAPQPAPRGRFAPFRAAALAPGVPAALATTFLNTAAAFAVLASFADHAHDAFGAGLDRRSLLFLVLGLASLPGALLSGGWADACGKKRFVAAALALSLAVTPLLLLPATFLAFVAASVPVAFVQSLRQGPFTALLAELAPGTLRGRLVGLNSVASGFGLAFGTWAGGVAYARGGLAAVVAFVVAALAASLAAFALGVPSLDDARAAARAPERVRPDEGGP